MRVVIFWIVCHLSLGHEKKALLNWSHSGVRESLKNSWFRTIKRWFRPFFVLHAIENPTKTFTVVISIPKITR